MSTSTAAVVALVSILLYNREFYSSKIFIAGYIDKKKETKHTMQIAIAILDYASDNFLIHGIFIIIH